jgi:hypothetical protein
VSKVEGFTPTILIEASGKIIIFVNLTNQEKKSVAHIYLISSIEML